ncbi:MAG: GTP-binding protein [Clostridia bacterium]|nr:GTP-binding protein [Clostridia bacterium]
MTKIDIISGFLGAGKTTLINKLIREVYSDEKLVLIENEFGEIGIDGGFLQDAGINITEMNSGCICCSLVGDFSRALENVITEYAPDRVLIEPSGVGKLSDVIRAVRDSEAKNVELNSFTVVVDVNKCKMYMKNFGEFFNDQIENAGCIIFSHTDRTTDAKLEEAVSLVKAHNADAFMVTTPISELTGEALAEAMERKSSIERELERLLEDEEICPECGHNHHHHEHDEHCEYEHHHEHDEHCEHEHHHEHGEHCEHEHHHEHGEHCEHEHHHEHDEHCGCGRHHGHSHHHADDVFTSWGRETVKKYSAEEIADILEKLEDERLYGYILRAKGIVQSKDGRWIHYDYVPGEPDVRYGSSAVTGKICVIGSQINEGALEELFGLN